MIFKYFTLQSNAITLSPYKGERDADTDSEWKS